MGWKNLKKRKNLKKLRRSHFGSTKRSKYSYTATSAQHNAQQYSYTTTSAQHNAQNTATQPLRLNITLQNTATQPLRLNITLNTSAQHNYTRLYLLGSTNCRRMATYVDLVYIYIYIYVTGRGTARTNLSPELL